ncbi:MAG TPA: hypothetical protein PLV21_11460 [Cyclobacteriaceae bacterium]|nr:hypothetical protein [Cyclobacteriaceae bacterium]HRJ82498.1 hypothetical protein [Cyclobacteriaceae bacterium]
MKTISFLKSTLAVLTVALLGIAVSCTDESAQLQQEAADIAEDAITDYYFEDADDMTGLALLADNATDGGRVADGPRVITITDPRFNCTGVVITITMDAASTPNVPKGVIVIDFGSGCTDVLGNLRKGKIIITFNGRRFLPGSTVTTTFDGYSVNDIALSGVRTLTNVTASNVEAPKFQVQLADGRAVWPDGTEATREHCFVREWIRAANPLNDAMVVTQCGDAAVAASGTNRRGRAYTMSITAQLVYKRGCPIAVSGIKQFTDVATSKVITVDYGDGTCDRIITITVDGNTRNVNVSKRG